MKMTAADLELFRAGCSDPWNEAAQELLNAFGVSTAEELLVAISTMPVVLLADVVARFWDAVNTEVIRAADAHSRVSNASGPAPGLPVPVPGF